MAAGDVPLHAADRQSRLRNLFLVSILFDGHGVGERLGAFRYNIYLLAGWAATVAAAFLQPDAPTSAGFLQASVFLAFAYLYPDFQLLLMFILPVKVKWLALLQWISYFFLMVTGNLAGQLMLTASVFNFFLFFWHDIVLRMKSGHWRMAQQAKKIRQAHAPLHQCAVCGETNLSDPTMSFRYCSKCAGTPCYCERHIQSHQHTAAGDVLDVSGSNVSGSTDMQNQRDTA